MSTWSSESSTDLLGCGVDAEIVARFEELEGPDSAPWPALFSPREIEHNRGLSSPKQGFCASFCAKEAVLKAVGVPIDYRDCELFFSPGREEQTLSLSEEFMSEHGIGHALARVVLHKVPEECVVSVCLFGERDATPDEEVR